MIKLFGGNKYIDLKWWTFPGGERNVKIVDMEEIFRFKSFTIECHYRNSDDLIDMMLLVNAIRNVDATTRLSLRIPYFPFARQDRVMTPGEPFALQIPVQLIRSCNFRSVEVWDAHSDVLAGMFGPGEFVNINQWELLRKTYTPEKNADFIVSPDAGSLKKIYKCSEVLGGIPVIRGDKTRDCKTGDISGVIAYTSKQEIQGKRLLIIDDIVDGGRGIIDLSRELKKYSPESISVYITHGIFSKGIDVFRGYIDDFYCPNVMNEDIASHFQNNRLKLQ